MAEVERVENIEEGREQERLTVLGKTIQSLIPEDVQYMITLKDKEGMVHMLQVNNDEQIEHMLVEFANRYEPMLRALGNILVQVVMSKGSSKEGC